MTTIELESQPRTDFDTPWKNILEIYFQPFIEMCHPDAAKNIDWSKGYESLDKELNSITRKSDLKKRTVDKLMKVWRNDGVETWVLLHTEVQSQHVSDFEKRMYVYNYRLFDRYNRPIVSLAVLSDDKREWRPSYYEQELWGCRTFFNFVSIKLLDYEAKQDELAASTNPFAIVILAHIAAIRTKKDKDKRFLSKLTLTRSLYEKGWDKTAILNLYTFIDWVIALPESFELRYLQQIEQFEQEKDMTYITSAERIGIKKGLEQGMELGLEQGLERGLKRGLAQGEKGMLLRQLARKFDAVPTSYHQQIEKAKSDELLEWADRIITADSLEDIFNK